MASTVITDGMLARLSEVEGQGGNSVGAAYFKIGEGGWMMQGINKVPRTPDETLTDLDCIVNPGLYPVPSRFTFQKNISTLSIEVLGGGEVNITCSVNTGEANDDGYGNPPEFWEIGIFTADNVLLAYRTFNKQTKYPDRSLRHVFHLTNIRP